MRRACCLFAFFFLLTAITLEGVFAAPFKVGVIAPLTGRVAVVGQALRNSIVLENEEAREKDSGEKEGGEKEGVEKPGVGTDAITFVFEDDEYDSKKSVSAAQKLISVDKVNALIVFGSGPSLAVAPVSSKANVPLIAMAFTGDLAGKYPHVFRVFLSVEQQISLIVKEMERRHYASVSLVATTLEATQAAKVVFSKMNKIPIAADEEVLPSDMDLRGVVTKLKYRDASATMLMLYPPQIAIAAKLLRASGYKGELFGLSFMLNPAEIAAAQGALDGAWAVAIDERGASGFVERYKARFGETPWHDGSMGYDIARVLREGRATGIEQYLDSHEAITGVYGSYRKARPRDFEPPATIKVIKNGQVVALE